MLKVLLLVAWLTPASAQPCYNHEQIIQQLNAAMNKHGLSGAYLDIPKVAANIMIKVMNKTGAHFTEPSDGIILVKGGRDLGQPIIISSVKGCFQQMAPIDAADSMIIAAQLERAHIKPESFKGGPLGGDNSQHDKDGEI